MTPITLTSAQVAIYINGKPYNQATGISWSIDWGISEKYGIDSSFPQDLADGKASVNIRISAIVTSFDGGVQKYGARALVSDLLQSPYSALRVVNRANGDTLLYVPNTRISAESIDSVVKQTVKFSFSMKGLVPYSGLDLAYQTS